MTTDHAASSGDTFEARAWALYDAANEVLHSIVDADQHGPDEGYSEKQEEWPRDDKGHLWYPDMWALKKALEAFETPVKEQKQ